MSIASELSRLSSNISDSLDAVAAKGVTVPSDSNSDDLPGLIASIEQSTPAIAIVDTPDSRGGIVREITALNISDSTLKTADQLAHGITAYNKNGVKLTGTALEGGEPVATIAVETAITNTPGVVAVLNDNFSSWEMNRVYFASIQGNTATGNYKGLSVTIIKHAQGMYYGFLRPANLTSVVNDAYLFDISVGSVITIYESENAIYPDPVKRIAIRPDAELAQTWKYDKHIVADEEIAIPAYSTSNQILIASKLISEVTADVENYRYYVTARSLVIPEYSTTNTGRGRFEWSSMIASHGFIFTPMAELHPLIDGEYTIATNSAAVQGGASYRGLYFTSSQGISVYTTTSYGIWTSYAAPTYVGGKMRINSPSFTMRGQPNILDEPYWNALTDIRFQYIIELWQVPIESLGYRGWQQQQSIDLALDCLYSASHTLT